MLRAPAGPAGTLEQVLLLLSAAGRGLFFSSRAFESTAVVALIEDMCWTLA